MPLVSPTFRIRCPYCRNSFHPGDCAIYSTATPGKLLRKPPMLNTGEYVKSRTFIEELSGPEFTTEMAVRQCPSCSQLLFEGIEMCDNLNIAIIGDSSSGKTHYIATLIDQLRRSALTQNGRGLVQLRPRNKATGDNYKKIYYDPIIQQRTAAFNTRPGRFDAQGNPIRIEPLVYQLIIQDNAASANSMLNLLFYDISGEELANNTALVQFGEHVLRADGIIYLADPMAMEHIFQQLPSEAKSTQQVPNRTAEEVLSTVMYRLEQYNRVRPDESISIPTAICISKADVLQHIISETVRPNYWLMYRPAYDGKAHVDDIKHVDSEVRSILKRYGENALLQMSNRFEQVNFFAISATGYPPDSSGIYPRIEPHRCLDPFIWILWKLNYLPAARY